MLFYEISAQTGLNVQVGFRKVTKKALKRLPAQPFEIPPSLVNVETAREATEPTGCC
jgi:hypothetical protein